MLQDGNANLSLFLTLSEGRQFVKSFVSSLFVKHIVLTKMCPGGDENAIYNYECQVQLHNYYFICTYFFMGKFSSFFPVYSNLIL